jgi:type 1 fimbriae regulatory protein FimE
MKLRFTRCRTEIRGETEGTLECRLTPAAVRKIVAKAGEEAGFTFPLHPHMLRHAAGYKLVNEGVQTRRIQEYLGHRDIRHTEKYTELDEHRLDGVWKE